MKLNVIHNKNQSPWYADDGLKFTCTQCGNCCTGAPGVVWISDVELHRLAHHLRLSVQETADKYCRQVSGKWSLKENVSPKGEYDCIFLKTIQENGTDRRICTVYPVRPLQCRTWPFWPEVTKSPAAWEHAQRRCPGMGKGKRYSQKEVEALRDAPDWPAVGKTPTSK